MKKAQTVTELARQLGLSITTVSMVLNGRAKQYSISSTTAERVKRAAEGMNYVPNMMARNLRLNKSGVIGVVFPHLRSDWAHHILGGMYGPFEQAGYIPFIINHQENPKQEAKLIESLLERRVDAFVINPIVGDVKIYRRIEDLGIPLVFLSDTVPDMPKIPSSVWDPDEASIAVRHLCEIGAKRIGYLGVRDERPMAKLRYDVFAKTVKSCGLPVMKKWVTLINPGEPVDHYLTHMFAPGKIHPDALFAVYDDCAMTAIDVLGQIGMEVPDDVAIATLSDSRLAGPQCYDLTTVRAPIAAEGRAAANLVLELLRHKDRKPESIRVTGGKLIIRGSTQK